MGMRLGDIYHYHIFLAEWCYTTYLGRVKCSLVVQKTNLRQVLKHLDSYSHQCMSIQSRIRPTLNRNYIVACISRKPMYPSQLTAVTTTSRCTV